MRFTSFIVAGALALVASAQTTSDSTASSTATSTASTVVSVDPAQSSEAACLKACKAGDVDCQSKCIAVPNPSGSQANATTECVAECPQGNGTATDNSNYADCVSGCIGQNYFTASGTLAGATATGTAATASGTAKASGTSSSTSSSASSSSTSDSGADAMRVGITGLSLLGLLAAFVAL